MTTEGRAAEVQTIIRRWTSAKSERGNHLSEHQHLSRYVRPTHCEFFEETNENRRPIIERLWDNTQIEACEQWGRGVNSMTHNPATDWVTYLDADADVNDDLDVRPWYGGVVTPDIREQLRYSGFYYGALNRLYDVAAYGYGTLYSYEEDDGEISFEYVPAPESYFTLNRKGLCKTHFRPLNLTVDQIEERKIDLSKCSKVVQNAADDRLHDQRFLFLHYVAPRSFFKHIAGEVDQVHPFVGIYVDMTETLVVDVHGYRDFPYHVLRWDPIPQSPYAAGIGYKTLPTIRDLNSKQKHYNRILENEADSPILAANQAEAEQQQRPVPGEMIYRGISGQGNRLYDPLYKSNVGSRSLKDEIKTLQGRIMQSFHNHLMLMLNNAQMTATEVESRDEKIVQAMGPFIIILFDDLKTCVDRVFHARMRAGKYDPLPAALNGNSKAEPQFNGILAKAHKKLTASNITQFFGEVLSLFGEVAPEEIEALDKSEAIRQLGDARAVPDGIIPSKKEREEQRRQREQAMQQQQATAMAPELARAAKDGAAAMRDLQEQEGGRTVALAP